MLIQKLEDAIKGSDMVFITAGLGGGTGTGAAPLFAKIAKEEGALTVAIVTKPFTFEGKKRLLSAESGLAELREYVDSMIIVSNNNLIEVIGRKPLVEAFQAADNVLRQGVQTITDLIAVPALINLDFADVKTIMENQGSALIGIGMADGEDKARAAAGNDIDAIFGVAINEKLGDSIIVTVIATGFDQPKESIVKAVPKSTSTASFAQPQIKQTGNETIEAPRYQESAVEEEDEEGSIPRFFVR